MTRREMLDRMALLGAGMVISPFHRTAQAAQEPRQRLLAQVGSLPEPEQKVRALEPMRYVVVTLDGPDDGGHFGKNTPGTRTSGLQEAFNYAKERGRNVFICGTSSETPGGNTAYVMEETLHIPWRHTFRCDGEAYWIAYRQSTGDAVWIDSMMCGRVMLGPIHSTSSDGAVVRIDPRTAGPDTFPGIGGTVFEFGALVGSAPMMGAAKAEEQKGSVLCLDASVGTIHACTFDCTELVAGDKIITMTGTHGVWNNSIKAFLARGNTGIEMGDSETPSANYHMNRIEAYVGPSPPGSVGVRIFGQKNILTLHMDRQTPGQDIIFEAESKDNLIIAQDPLGITNNATTPTNRIITLTPVGFDIPTPPIPASGEDVVNRNPYLVQMIVLSPGQVSEWTLADAGGSSRTIAAGLSAGQSLVLKPGDRIRFTYTVAPSWTWNALG